MKPGEDRRQGAGQCDEADEIQAAEGEARGPVRHICRRDVAATPFQVLMTLGWKAAKGDKGHLADLAGSEPDRDAAAPRRKGRSADAPARPARRSVPRQQREAEQQAHADTEQAADRQSRQDRGNRLKPRSSQPACPARASALGPTRHQILKRRQEISIDPGRRRWPPRQGTRSATGRVDAAAPHLRARADISAPPSVADGPLDAPEPPIGGERR